MRLNDLPYIMIKCLLCTIIIEVIIGIIVGIRDKKDIVNIILVNILTNPIVVSLPIYIMMRYSMKARYYVLIILELLTVVVEGIIYSRVLKYKKMNSYLIAIILNIGSYFIGEVINWVTYMN